MKLAHMHRYSATHFVIFLIALMSNVISTDTAWSQNADTLWSENWEAQNWTVDWHVSGGTWEVGMPTSGPGAPYKGQNCAATVLGGNYSEWVDHRLIRHTSFIVPSASENPRLRFWHWYSFSAGDYGKVQISTNGGTTWTDISPSYQYFNTGSAVWTYPYIDLSSYAGMPVQIAFYLHSEDVSGNGGPDVSSGWYIDDIALIKGTRPFQNPDGFELGIGEWTSENGTWEVGKPTGNAFAGQNCAATVLHGNYHEWVNSRLISAPLFVPGKNQNPRLRFWHWYSFSAGDYGRVEIKVNGGAWKAIPTSYTNTGSNVWTYPSIDLSPYADSLVQIAFFFHSEDVSGNGGPDVALGWYIDDVVLVKGVISVNNPETFESGIGDWASERGTWEVDAPLSGWGPAHSPPNCAAAVLNGNYHEWVDSRFISPPYALGDNPVLRFWHKFSFSAGDYGEVQISADNGPWQTISIRYVNTSSGVWSPEFIPLSAFAGKTVRIGFFFHSEDVSGNGGPDVSDGWYIDDVEIDDLTTEISDPSIEQSIINSYRLFQNYPNPFNPETTIEFALPKPSQVTIQLYNLLGQRIRTLVDQEFQAGIQSVKWDARNDDGEQMPSGVYLYRIEAGSFTATRRLLLMR